MNPTRSVILEQGQKEITTPFKKPSKRMNACTIVWGHTNFVLKANATQNNNNTYLRVYHDRNLQIGGH